MIKKIYKWTSKSIATMVHKLPFMKKTEDDGKIHPEKLVIG